MPQPVDRRREVPRTDLLLADPRLEEATGRLGPFRVREAVQAAQQAARAGEVEPEDVVTDVLTRLPDRATSLRAVLNATGVVLHTNLGRAPLSAAASEAMAAAAAYVDVELDLATGQRSRRGAAVPDALLQRVPCAEAALVVNNGAAALVLATTALAGGGEVLVSRGEMVEIGDGFRLPDLITSCGAKLREVGTTNRTRLTDYADAVGPDTRLVLKVHPSNFMVTGFTSSVDVEELARLGVPVVHDIGSGLLTAHPLLPDEPDATSSLAAGAALVTCSGDKLLGGPQAGLALGRADLVERMRRHPLARALRPDKTTLAALEATLTGPPTPTWLALTADPTVIRRRCDALARKVGSVVAAEVVPSVGVVGGGGAPGVRLDGWAVALPEPYAVLLRATDPPVVGRLEGGRCLLDLRAVPAISDPLVESAIRAVATAMGPSEPAIESGTRADGGSGTAG